MDSELLVKVKHLGLKYLEESWKEVCDGAQKNKTSYHKLLSDIVEKEYLLKVDKARLARLKAAKIPELFLMEQFPFARQPRLKKKFVMEVHDSLSYIEQSQSVCLIGPTGVGKSGIAIALLIHAIDNGYRGRYIAFTELMELLLQARADFSSKNMINKFAKVDCLVIDDLGVGQISERLLSQSGFFFDLINKRHNKKCTIIASQYGFDEWGSYFNDAHLTAALQDRLTVNCLLFDMKKCKSIRNKDIQHGTIR